MYDVIRAFPMSLSSHSAHWYCSCWLGMPLIPCVVELDDIDTLYRMKIDVHTTKYISTLVFCGCFWHLNQKELGEDVEKCCLFKQMGGVIVTAVLSVVSCLGPEGCVLFCQLALHIVNDNGDLLNAKFNRQRRKKKYLSRV